MGVTFGQVCTSRQSPNSYDSFLPLAGDLSIDDYIFSNPHPHPTPLLFYKNILLIFFLNMFGFFFFPPPIHFALGLKISQVDICLLCESIKPQT